MKRNLFDTQRIRNTHMEHFEVLLEAGNPEGLGGFRIERILSFGQTTPEGEWYDQAWTEWVALVRGMAVLAYDNGETITLRMGDHLLIPPHRRHRVTFTRRPAIAAATAAGDRASSIANCSSSRSTTPSA